MAWLQPRVRLSTHDHLLPATLAAAVALALLALGPAPGDAPAHLYRTFLVEHGTVLWDNFWYAGHYPLASYSLLYYFPAALVGNLPIVLAAVIATALLFTAIAYHEWGSLARWPARTFGVVAAAPMFTGLYSFSLGLATLLAALRLLQQRRTALALVAAALTLGISPLAFIFLCAVVFALFVARRNVDRHVIFVGCGLAAIGAIEAAVLTLFPGEGTYPFNPIDLAAVLAVCTLGAYIASRAEHGRIVASFFIVWGLGSIAAYVVPSAVGDNWTRLRGFVFPLMLLAAAQARFRPRPLVLFALAGALTYNLVPYLMLIPYRTDARPAKSAFWQPALSFLASHRDPNFRVEVVPTAAHWESYWLPRAGYPLARGWYRQLDEQDNPVLYGKQLTPLLYRRWLRTMGVRYVLVPQTVLDPVGGPKEARAIESPDSGLRLVFTSPAWRIYALPHPTPLLTGPRPASLESLDHKALTGVVKGGGTYVLRVRFNPYWSVGGRGVCLSRTPSDMTQLTAAGATQFSLETPSSLSSVVDVLTDGSKGHCSAR